MGKRLTQEEFINKVTAVNFDKNYDYSLIEYVNCSTKVRVICPSHGEFLSRPDHLWAGHGCRACRDAATGVLNSIPKEEAIRRLYSVVDQNKYDLSKVEYAGYDTKVAVICREHGEFLITPRTLFRGCGCRLCFVDSMRQSQEEFLDKAKIIRPEYDYSLVEYESCRTKIKVICKEHGVFLIKPNNLLAGQGCSSCSSIGFDKNKPALMYINQVDGIFSFTGFGITRNVKKRDETHKSNLKASGCFVVEQYKSPIYHGEFILGLETLLKQIFPLSPYSKDIPGFKTESTTAPYSEVVAFVQQYIENNKELSAYGDT